MNNTPSITLDFKKYRIRITKQTVNMMRYPDNIQILVNPEHKLIALRATENKSKDSQKIKRGPEYKREEYELFSKNFLEELLSISSDLKAGKTYRVTGSFIDSENMSIFDINSARLLED